MKSEVHIVYAFGSWWLRIASIVDDKYVNVRYIEQKTLYKAILVATTLRLHIDNTEDFVLNQYKLHKTAA